MKCYSRQIVTGQTWNRQNVTPVTFYLGKLELGNMLPGETEVGQCNGAALIKVGYTIKDSSMKYNTQGTIREG